MLYTKVVGKNLEINTCYFVITYDKKESEKKNVLMNHCVVHLKQTRHFKSAILQLEKE